MAFYEGTEKEVEVMKRLTEAYAAITSEFYNRPETQKEYWDSKAPMISMTLQIWCREYILMNYIVCAPEAVANRLVKVGLVEQEVEFIHKAAERLWKDVDDLAVEFIQTLQEEDLERRRQRGEI